MNRLPLRDLGKANPISRVEDAMREIGELAFRNGFEFAMNRLGQMELWISDLRGPRAAAVKEWVKNAMREANERVEEKYERFWQGK